MDMLDVKELIKDILKYAILIFVIIFVITNIITIQQVIGSSMEPNLKDGDILLLSKMHYKIGSVKRGDVVALKFKDTNYLVKRVVGLPGDSIEIKDTKLYINNKLYKEEYINESTMSDFKLTNLGYDKIPKDKYFVLGDNRDISSDSRDLGLIDKKDILGKTIFRFWPITKMKIIK